MADQPVSLYTATVVVDNCLDIVVQVLVTVWPDGQMDVALRPDDYATWGPPVAMTPRDTG